MTCLCEKLERRRLLTANGGFQTKMQCLDCGRVGQAIKKEPGDENLPVIDAAARESQRRRASEAAIAEWKVKLEQEQRKREQETEAIRQQMRWEYAKYLKSDEWREMRNRVLRRDGYVCRCCLVRAATEVHHLTYQAKAAGFEAAFWLIAVCRECHGKLEEIKHAT